MDMGLGQLGNDALVFKRKYRWTLQLSPNCGGTIPEAFVKVAARPSLTIDEQEINYLHGKMWIPGKGTWETMSVTYYDIGNAGPGMTALFSWLASVYQFTNPTTLYQASTSAGYACTGVLTMYDGVGAAMETWTMRKMWPTAVNFGELDYSNTEPATIDLTLRYSEVQYTSLCGGVQINPCHTGCSAPSTNGQQQRSNSGSTGTQVVTGGGYPVI